MSSIEEKPDVQKKGGNSRFKKKNRNRNQHNRHSNATKFKGETESLHGHIYDVGVYNQTELFTETTKKMASYTGQTYKEPQDIQRAIEEVKDIDILMPTKRTNITITTLKAKLYKNDIEIWSKRESLYRQNKAAMYSVVLGQCTEAIKAKIEADTQYKSI